MDRQRVEELLALFESRGEVEAIDSAGVSTGLHALRRADDRRRSADLLLQEGHSEAAFTLAYDGFRMAAESVVLALGHRVPAVPGAHRITAEIAAAAIGEGEELFTGAVAERFRAARHRTEYFDPERPEETTEADAEWAIDHAHAAIAAVNSALRHWEHS